MQLHPWNPTSRIPTCAWIGVGFAYSDFRITPIKCVSKPKWTKLTAGLVGWEPDTFQKKNNIKWIDQSLKYIKGCRTKWNRF